MDTVLITGGGGYIGSILAEQLLRAGHRVKIYDRFFFGRGLLDPLRKNPQLELIRGDTRCIIADVFRGVSAVVHLADLSNDPSCDLDPEISRDINLNGTLRVARTARDAGVSRFVYSSSCSVYGNGSGAEKLNEESPTRPMSLYAKLKLIAERELLRMANQDFCVTVLRNATVYGISYRMRFDLVLNLMTLYAFRNRKVFILGGGKQWRPLIHVRDVARAFVETMLAPTDKVAGQIFNVGSDELNFQVAPLAAIVCDAVPYTQIEKTPDDHDKRTYKVDFAKITRVLGFRVTHGVRDGITEVLEALKSGGVDDNIRTNTLQFYRYLIEAEQVVREVSLNGRILDVVGKQVELPRKDAVRAVMETAGRPDSSADLEHRLIPQP